MKNIVSILAATLVAASALATGVSGLNSPQSGVFVYTNGGSLSMTNTFNPVFTVTPIVTAIASATNAGTPSVTATTSNLVITTSGTGSTNYTVSWSAQYGYPLIQSGTVSLVPGALTTNTFNVPYGVTPVVIATGSSTNSYGDVGVMQIGTSSFVLQSTATNNVNWAAFGRTITPGSYLITQ